MTELLSSKNLIKYILPKGILDYFTIVKVEEIFEQLYISLEEKNTVPSEYSNKRILSKGFFKTTIVQDFPVRGMPVFLRIKRRRWKLVDTGEIVFRNWELVAEGTKYTQEFATFLKGLLR
jgi:transposase